MVDTVISNHFVYLQSFVANTFIPSFMKNNSFSVYETPEAEEMKIVIESTILSGTNEDPEDPCPEFEGIEI